MIIFLQVLGLLVIVLGSPIVLFTENIFFGIISLVGGALVLGVSKMIEQLQDMNHKILGISLTDSQINTIIRNSRSYHIESEVFPVYPDNETKSPLIVLEGEYYINARLFKNNLKHEEYEYRLALPGKEQIVMNLSEYYYKGVLLFKWHDQLLLKISAVPLTLTMNKDRIIFE